jgi:cytochrome c peroxidase
MNRLARSLVLLSLTVISTAAGRASAQPAAPPSLKTVSPPLPRDLDHYVADRAAAIRLGKAFFWDSQVGSSGNQACATCHFHAGVDNRVKNTVHPGADLKFQVRGPEQTLALGDFPFHRLADPDNQFSAVLKDSDDRVGSQGVVRLLFAGIQLKDRVDKSTTNPLFNPDPIFSVNGVNTRQSTGRQTPTMINAIFNHRSFWDGRANNVFNGVNPFGERDPSAQVWADYGSGAVSELVRLENASLASQAVGPPNNEVEMAWEGRKFPELGRKLLSLKKPLAKQVVSPADSVLGGIAKITGSRLGVTQSYQELIDAAIQPAYRGTTPVVIGSASYTLTEANFSLIWGLAVMLYESTLVSDDTPFDRFREGNTAALTAQQIEGMGIFLNDGNCIACHAGPEFTSATVGFHDRAEVPDPLHPVLTPAQLREEVVERMVMSTGVSLYDAGFYNIGVRPSREDLGVGNTDPFGNPLSFTRQLVSGQKVDRFEVDPCAFRVGPCVPVASDERVSVDGSFKVPSLRNIELTGPYMHNGGIPTLEGVVEFYTRGGDFHQQNLANMDAEIQGIGSLWRNPERKAALVAFLKALTDERVRYQMAPFDHPSIDVPNGLVIPAVGAAGGPAIEGFTSAPGLLP